LAVAGGSVSYSLNLWDLGETARIDNSGPLTRKVATSVNAINVYAAASDIATVADVNAVAGPLKGFLANTTPPADTDTVAAAYVRIDNNVAGAKIADGVTQFDFKTTTGTLALSLTDASKAYSGLKASKLCLDLSTVAGTTRCYTGEVFTVATGANVGTLTTPAANAGAAVTAIPTTGTFGDVWVTFEADATTALGTSRTFALTGTVTPQVGAAHAIADTTTSKNATAWVWSANAIELWAPYFTTNTGFISRFAFQNTGNAVGYSSTCLAESGNVVTAGAKSTGTLVAGMTVVNATEVCTFSGNTRGTVRFVINAPAGNVHGTYNLVAPGGVSISVETLTRPYSAGTY